MSKHDFITIRLSSAENTTYTGGTLVQAIYGKKATVLLRGDLGAGKTTFVRGIAEKLGVKDAVTSPTYALEQRYESDHSPLIHIDLYRLNENQARDLLLATEDFEGIRCIEWPERSGTTIDADIDISLTEESHTTRKVAIEFLDSKIPSEELITKWRQDVMLPEHIIAHCEAVAEVCARLADALLERGVVVRKDSVIAAGKLHDLLRFIDFREQSNVEYKEATPDEVRTWEHWKKTFEPMHHEEACTVFLKQQGYSILGDIVRPHGLSGPQQLRPHTEQKILFYADKRVKFDQIVSLQERFDDFVLRYGRSPETDHWHDETLAIEKELFPDGVPF